MYAATFDAKGKMMSAHTHTHIKDAFLWMDRRYP